MSKISCFMNVRNVLSQGYPFVQAIKAALHICDEFIISDGYSTDGTFEILKSLKDQYSKIDLVRIQWNLAPSYTKRGEVIAETANKTRQLCSGEYLFYIQANEVIHEKSINTIKNLPKLFPYIEIFHLPYYLILGKDILIDYGFRPRLFKNIPDIAVVGDAGHVSYTYKAMAKRFLSIFLKINKDYKIYDVFTRGGIDSRLFAHFSLPSPIFRYIGLSPEAYLSKLRGHTQLFRAARRDLEDIEKKIKKYGFSSSLLREMMKEKRAGLISNHIIRIPIRDQPEVMRKALEKVNVHR